MKGRQKDKTKVYRDETNTQTEWKVERGKNKKRKITIVETCSDIPVVEALSKRRRCR